MCSWASESAMHSRTGKYFMLTVLLPHLYPPILSDHSYLMRVSVCLPLPLFTLELPRLGQSSPPPPPPARIDVPFLLVLRRKRYREEIKSFFSIKKTDLLIVRPRNCETFTLAELIKSPSIAYALLTKFGSAAIDVTVNNYMYDWIFQHIHSLNRTKRSLRSALCLE